MAVHEPERSEKNDNQPPAERPPQLTADAAGVAMTGSDFNNTLRAIAMGASGLDMPPLSFTDNKEWQPSLSPTVRDLHKSDFVRWTGEESARLGFKDEAGDNKYDNAFRHTLTAAIYTMKYGPAVTSELGWMNEQKDFNIYKSLTGKIDFDKISDTNTDLLNNQSGIRMAEQLIKEKGAANVTIKDLEDRAAEMVRKGEVVTHPDQELRSGKLAPETLSYHTMPGLIKWEAANGPTAEDRRKAQEIVDERHLK